MKIQLNGKEYDISCSTKKFMKKHCIISGDTKNMKRYCSNFIKCTIDDGSYYVIFDKIEYKNKILHGTFFEINNVSMVRNNIIGINKISTSAFNFNKEYFEDCRHKILLTTDDYNEYLKWKLLL